MSNQPRTDIQLTSSNGTRAFGQLDLGGGESLSIRDLQPTDGVNTKISEIVAKIPGCTSIEYSRSGGHDGYQFHFSTGENAKSFSTMLRKVIGCGSSTKRQKKSSSYQGQPLVFIHEEHHKHRVQQGTAMDQVSQGHTNAEQNVQAAIHGVSLLFALIDLYGYPAHYDDLPEPVYQIPDDAIKNRNPYPFRTLATPQAVAAYEAVFGEEYRQVSYHDMNDQQKHEVNENLNRAYQAGCQRGPQFKPVSADGQQSVVTGKDVLATLLLFLVVPLIPLLVNICKRRSRNERVCGEHIGNLLFCQPGKADIGEDLGVRLTDSKKS